jgi:hypothetical protein
MRMRELDGAQFGSLFASPLLEHVWSDGPALNVELRDSILRHAERHSGMEQTNIGGWHSVPGTLDFCRASGARLIQWIGAMTEEATRRLYACFGRQAERASWTLSAWANISWQGHSNTMHTHPGATWSGVYYVDHGELDSDVDGAAIHLSDPNAARANVFFRTFHVRR